MSALISDFLGSDSTTEEGGGNDNDNESPVFGDDDDAFQWKLACPLCSLVTRDMVGLFQHTNTSHIVRCQFLDVEFLKFHHCCLCAEFWFSYCKCFPVC